MLFTLYLQIVSRKTASVMDNRIQINSNNALSAKMALHICKTECFLHTHTHTQTRF